jgi:trk system potassium uptake protein TrkA
MKQFAVIGLGRFGMAVARYLSAKGFQVLAIDKDTKKVEIASEFATRAIELDATEEENLKESGIQNVDAAIVGIGKNVEASILITLNLKELGIQPVFSKAFSPLQGKVLQKIGADRIIYPEKEMGEKIAESLVSPEISEFIKLSHTHTLVEVKVPKLFEGKTIGELEVSRKYGVQIVAIKRKITYTEKNGKIGTSEKIIIAPGPMDGLIKGDRLIVLGENRKIENIRRLKE